MVNKYRLLEKINDAGYTQRALAEEIGISKNALNSKINSHSTFNLVEVKNICDKLNIVSGTEKAEIFLA